MDAEQIISTSWAGCGFEGAGRDLRARVLRWWGLTPSDLLRPRCPEPRSDELSAQYAVADVLRGPLQRGLLFQSAFAGGSDDDVYAVQLGLTVTGDLDTDRLREAVRTRWSAAIRTWRHGSSTSSASRFRFSRSTRRSLGGRSHSTPMSSSVEQLLRRWVDRGLRSGQQPTFRAALITMPGNRHRLVLTIHHIVIDGWSLPIPAAGDFTSYHGQHSSQPGPTARSSAG